MVRNKSPSSKSSLPLPPFLTFQRPRELREFALVVDHLQVLDVMPDVAGAPQEAVLRACKRHIQSVLPEA